MASLSSHPGSLDLWENPLRDYFEFLLFTSSLGPFGPSKRRFVFMSGAHVSLSAFPTRSDSHPSKQRRDHPRCARECCVHLEFHCPAIHQSEYNSRHSELGTGRATGRRWCDSRPGRGQKGAHHELMCRARVLAVHLVSYCQMGDSSGRSGVILGE